MGCGGVPGAAGDAGMFRADRRRRVRAAAGGGGRGGGRIGQRRIAQPLRRQGRGVGRRLLAAGLDQAGRLGVVAVLLEVAPGNAAARRLYAAAGFEAVGRRRGYYGNGGDALVLRLALADRGRREIAP